MSSPEVDPASTKDATLIIDPSLQEQGNIIVEHTGDRKSDLTGKMDNTYENDEKPSVPKTCMAEADTESQSDMRDNNSMLGKDSGIDLENPSQENIEETTTFSIIKDGGASSSSGHIDNTWMMALNARLMLGRGINRSYYEDYPSRSSSILPQYSRPGSRRASLDTFYGQPHPHHKISVISNMSYASSVDFATDTCEALPHADHYREPMSVLPNIKHRPTLDELREDSTQSKTHNLNKVNEGMFDAELKDIKEGESKPEKTYVPIKYGWIQGVLLRCVLNIFGVMLFLRLHWIAGQAGIGLASVIILVSCVITTITTTSMSAVCTNGEVQGGGAYYMISRSLGPEFGGSIGLVFSLASAVASGMYIVGFAETVRDIMWENGAKITGDSFHEVRIISAITAFLLMGIVVVGMEWEAKAQIVLLVILIAALVNYAIGTFLPPTPEKIAIGIVGYEGEVFSENFGPNFRGEGFFSVFSIFFPAVTGILAGANISGDLKDAQSAIPKGTLIAILITGTVYLGIVWTSGSCIIRDAVGTVALTQIANKANISLETVLSNRTLVSNCLLTNGTCEYGLLNDKGAVGIASAFRPLLLAGIFSATLSSALASLLGAPKVFQALAKDKLFPFIEFFSKGRGKGNDPIRGYVLTFFVCLAVTCIAEVDAIAPIISNFFLMSFALINYACFHASIAKSPGFRPGFKYYNKWVSLVGSLLCFSLMFLVNWWAALLTFVIVVGLYVYVHVTKPDANWGSSTQALAYTNALSTSLHLLKIDEHVKNFRPQILVLSGFPRNRPALLNFVSSITKKQSLLVCGHVFRGEMSDHIKNLRSTAAYKWFDTKNFHAFYNSVVAPNLRIGAQVLMQALGVGKLRPNTLMIGYKNNWQNSDPSDLEEYVNIIEDAFDLKYGVGILRACNGFDVMKITDDSHDLESSDTDEREELSDEEDENTSTNSMEMEQIDSYEKDSKLKFEKLSTVHESEEVESFEDDKRSSLKSPWSLPALRNTSNITGSTFKKKMSGTIDVWWLYDDGGLTLLIPYILSKRKQWKDCKLRIFCTRTKKSSDVEDKLRMTELLKKFRIDFEQLTIVKNLTKKPTMNMYRDFEVLIRNWRIRTGEYPSDFPWKINDGDLITNKMKTYRYIRLREQLIAHSQDASLIVLTLPIPRKTSCPGALYMSWLETITHGLPPTLLLRGNQQNVLTYYS